MRTRMRSPTRTEECRLHFFLDVRTSEINRPWLGLLSATFVRKRAKARGHQSRDDRNHLCGEFQFFRIDRQAVQFLSPSSWR
jgi:hypothetical protein